jgi:hypothetical protein
MLKELVLTRVKEKMMEVNFGEVWLAHTARVRRRLQRRPNLRTRLSVRRSFAERLVSDR